MSLVEIAPIIGALIFFAMTLPIVIKAPGRGAVTWAAPAVLCIGFFAWSLAAVTLEGATGFWVEHTRNLWGVQIWFDLLLAVGVGLFLIAPRAKEAGMQPLPWLLVIALTGSIGFLAMTTRLLSLERSAPR